MSAQTAEQACARWRMTISINDLETPATTGFLAGHASRDAEVTALVAERTSLWGSVTKYAAEVAELRTKLTEAERLNKVALEAMKKAAQVTEFDYEHESAFTVCCGARFDKRGSDDQPNEHADDCYLNSAIMGLAADRIAELEASFGCVLEGGHLKVARLEQEVARLTTHIRAIAEHHQGKYESSRYREFPECENIMMQMHAERRDFALKVFDV